MVRARIPDEDGVAALAVARAAAASASAASAAAASSSAARGAEFASLLPRPVLALAVRYSLQVLAERAKGNTVEVRVPPFGAIQCIEGPGHTRGTPPNVVEMDAATWVALATGDLAWESGIERGIIHASGQRADLRGYVPVANL